MGTLAAGVVAFPDAQPDDGLLEIGVITADSALQWARVLSRLVVSDARHSPFAHVGHGRTVKVELDRPTIFELDGGARKEKKKFRVSVEPRAITVCVPRKEDG
jgi:diacylglycerol kinase family enzyme